MNPPYLLTLEFAPGDAAADPLTFRPEPRTYLLRSEGGVFDDAVFPWSLELLRDLEAVRRPDRDPALVQRVGELLRRFLERAGWSAYEEQILAAQQKGRRVLLTIRSAAVELYALPWELLTLRGSGQHIGELSELLLRYEWPAPALDRSSAAPPPSEGGRVLFAWSASGGAVPAGAHLSAILRAGRAVDHPFDPQADVLPNVTCGALTAELERSARAGRPVAVLHLLCHGTAVGTTFGLALDGEEAGARHAVVDAGRLRQLLAPHSQTLRLVVLAACDSGDIGAVGNQLGSVAQTLHRAGIAAVVASRYPLSVSGSTRLAEKLYQGLLGDSLSLECSLLAARRHLAVDSTQLDWASVQLYARASDGDDTRPVVFRPFRGLLSFQPAHARYFFGREHEAELILEKLSALALAGQPRFVVVAGASGTGKSSLVMAGALPRLLAADPRWLLASLRADPESVAAIDALIQRADTEDRPLLLLIDQFEEIFTRIRSPAAQQSFVQRLWQLASLEHKRHTVLVTLRVDYLGRCGDLAVDRSGLRLDAVAYSEAHRVLLAQLGPGALREIIMAPIERVGLMYEEGLVERILQEVASEPGALPLLEDTLDLLWQKRHGRLLTQTAYEALGCISGALRQRADSLIASLSVEEQLAARRLLVQLVDVSDDVALSTRRRGLVRDLRPVVPANAGHFDAVLAKLLTARLLATDGTGDAQTVEVAHEALIRKWPLLQEWVRTDRQLLLDLARLEEWAVQWREYRTTLTAAQLEFARDVSRRAADQVPSEVAALIRDAAAKDALRRRFTWLLYAAALAPLFLDLIELTPFPAGGKWLRNIVLCLLAVVLMILSKRSRAAHSASPPAGPTRASLAR